MTAIYADRNRIFFATDAHGEAVPTQFGRACEALGIELIPAHSPQAKGRVERFNGTAHAFHPRRQDHHGDDPLGRRAARNRHQEGRHEPRKTQS